MAFSELVLLTALIGVPVHFIWMACIKGPAAPQRGWPYRASGVPMAKAQNDARRRRYVTVFWSALLIPGILSAVATPATGEIIGLIELGILAYFLYETFTMLRLVGHTLVHATLLCLVPIVPIAVFIQLSSIGQRCTELFGPLGAPDYPPHIYATGTEAAPPAPSHRQ